MVLFNRDRNLKTLVTEVAPMDTVILPKDGIFRETTFVTIFMSQCCSLNIFYAL